MKYSVLLGVLLDTLKKEPLSSRGYQQQVVKELKEVLAAAKGSL
jgi:hypothetical protein